MNKLGLLKGAQKTYKDAKAHIDSDRILYVTRDDEIIAQFHSDHYQYWEYEEEQNRPLRY